MKNKSPSFISTYLYIVENLSWGANKKHALKGSWNTTFSSGMFHTYTAEFLHCMGIYKKKIQDECISITMWYDISARQQYIAAMTSRPAGWTSLIQVSLTQRFLWSQDSDFYLMSISLHGNHLASCSIPKLILTMS